MNKQTEVLKKSAKTRKEKMYTRVYKVIAEFKNNSIPINFQKVSRHAAVSKVWLYQQDELRSMIDSIRSKSRCPNSIADENILATYKVKVKKLESKVLQLEKVIAEQGLKIEVAYGKMIGF